jgi:uncharacterized protein involved in exopolysaccharide biosynthesis
MTGRVIVYQDNLVENNMEDESKGLGEYLDIFIRRRYLVVIPAIILSIVAVTVVSFLPATYKSQGMILIEAQEIPADLVRSTVTSYADQRIQIIKQRILTTANVMEIINKFDLYKDQRKKSLPSSQLVAQFRSNMSVNMVEANVTDPRSGRRKKATIAFRVSFLDPSPKVAQVVASELVTKFLSENVRTRTERAADTQAFLESEAAKFQKKIQDLESKIADFKNEYRESLPELLQYNLSLVDRYEKELVTNENRIMALKDQIVLYSLEQSSIPQNLSVESLPELDPQSDLKSQLSSTRSQYNALLTRYSASHPDVINLRKQLENLETQLGGSFSSNDISDRLSTAVSELELLQQKYSDNHPDIKAAKSKVETLRKESELVEIDKSLEAEPTRTLVNPSYARIQAKITLTERDIERLLQRQKTVRVQLEEAEQRVLQTHQVKRAYDDLIRDRANHISKYQELKSKQLQAELAQNLESENKGESFSLIEPPKVPSKAEKPNRPKLMAMGIAVSVGFGFALAFLVELLFGGVRGYKEIAKVTGLTPLVVVPVIHNTDDLKKKRNRKYRIAFYILVIMTMGVIAFHFFVMNLELLWFKVIRKISLL